MFRFSLSLMVVFYLCLPQNGTAKTFTSQQDGNWHDPVTWGETVDLPTSTDSVVIDGHDIFLSDANTSIAYLKITNLSGSNVNVARLDINAGITFSVSGDVDITAENVDQEVKFVQSSSSIANISGNFSMTRVLGNSQSKSLSLTLSNTAQLQVTQAFSFAYHGGSEASYEIYTQNSAQLTVSGAVNLTQTNGADFSMIGTGSSIIDFQDDFNISASNGNGIDVTISSLADIQVGNDLNITNSGASQTKLGITVGGGTSIGGDLSIQSSSTSDNAYVDVSGAGSTLDIDGNISFSALSDGDSYLNLTGGGKAYLAGSLNRPSNYGSLIMTSADQFYFDGTVAQSIPPNTLSGAGTDSLNFSNLILQNNAGITLTGDLIVDEDVELNSGIITTKDTALLIIADGATISGGNSSNYVDGPLVKRGSTNGSSFIFPVGNNGQYAPIEIAAVADKDTEYKAKYTGCPPPVGHLFNAPLESVSSVGYWELERADGLAVGDIILHWSDADAAGVTDLADVLVAYLKDLSTGWYSLGKGATTGGVGVGVSGSVAHDTGCPPPVGGSIFAIGFNDATLPVELIKFKANWVESDQQVNLYWEAETSINSDHFIVEKSYDGYHFEAIAEKTATQNGNSVAYYSTIDNAPGKGNNYYRIMSVDQDGMMSFSRTINVFVKAYEELPIAYPNPADDYVRIYSKSLENQEVTVEVFDMRGRRLYQKRHQASQGHLYFLTNQLRIQKAGNYLLTYKDGAKVHSMMIAKRP